MRGTPSFSILPIDASHINGFRDAWDTVAREKQYLALLRAPLMQEVQAMVMNNLRVGNPHFVALVNEQVVGWCDIVRHRLPTACHRGALSIGLLTEMRCLGIGTALIDHALKAAWANDFKRVDLVARADNVHAIALYQRHGFEIEGLQHKAFHLDGHYYDLIDMALLHPDLAEADPLR